MTGVKTCALPISRWDIMADYNVHYSEWAWVGCKIDGVIKNDGTIEDLTNKLKSDILFS